MDAVLRSESGAWTAPDPLRWVAAYIDPAHTATLFCRIYEITR